MTFRGEAATLHGSTLLTEKNPSLVTSVTGGPGAAYWGISFLPRGSKVVSRSRKPKTDGGAGAGAGSGQQPGGNGTGN